MHNDCCFRSAAQGQLSQYNRKKSVLRAAVKSHNGLKGKKVFACGCSERNQNVSKFAENSPCWNPFIVKLQPAIAYKKAKVKITGLRDLVTAVFLSILRNL